jgi:subtilisin family serine protease
MSRLFRRGAVFLFTSALIACATPVSALAQTSATVTTPAARSSVIVGVSDAGHMAPVLEALEAAGGSIKKTYAWNAFLVSAPVGVSSTVFSATAQGISGVTYAQGNATVHAAGTANDPAFSLQWGLPDIGATSAWDVSQGSGVSVAVLDSGIDANQPDLDAPGQVVMNGAFNYIAPGSLPYDDYWHGTHVAGIIAATRNNSAEGAGTAPLATLYAFKVLDSTGSGDDGTVASAIYDVIAKTPCKIISMSFGGGGDPGGGDPALESAVAAAQAAGVLVVAAAGNGDTNGVGTTSPVYPAAVPGVIGVGAVDQSNGLASWSNYGPVDEDLVAPGVDIWSTLPIAMGFMQKASGTSMATPFVSGSAALVWSAHPSWTATEVADALENTAQDLGSPGMDATYGYGLVRPDLALDATVSAPPTSTPPATETITAALSASSVKLRVPFVLSGTLTPSTVGRTVVVLVQKPGSGRWSYSSARLTYGTAANGGALWWYRYVPIVRGTYRFQSTFAGDASGTAAASRLVSVSVR